MVKKLKRFKDDFINFAVKGNMIDLAVGIIIGSAFTGIVNSLVKDIIMPLLSPLVGRLDFTNLFIAMDGGQYDTAAAAAEKGVALLQYGNFITLVLNFVIVAFCIFILIRWINKIREKVDGAKETTEETPAEAPTTKTCPFCVSEIPIAAVKCPHCTSDL